MQRLKNELVNESDISRFINNFDLDNKIKKLAARAKLKAEQDKIFKLERHDLSYILGKDFLVMIVLKIRLFNNQRLKKDEGTDYVLSW